MAWHPEHQLLYDYGHNYLVIYQILNKVDEIIQLAHFVEITFVCPTLCMVLVQSIYSSFPLLHLFL